MLDNQGKFFNQYLINDHYDQISTVTSVKNITLVSLLYLYGFLMEIQVRCEEELIEAIETATGAKKDCLCFIEVIVHKDDTSKELLEWGSRVCAANSRPPNPQ